LVLAIIGGSFVTLPHTLKRIHLNLARSKQFPSGSTRHGYEFVAPLDAAGHIDPQIWHQHRDHCRVRRFWQGEDDQVGLKVQAALGVPYSAEMIANAQADAKTQASADAPEAAALSKRYPKAAARDYDGNPARITEADALIAYLQVLGTFVDFKLYDDKANMR
jgi:hypothetical protein